MKEVRGDLFSYLDPDSWSYIVIPTNGDVRADKTAVMGRGIALQAARLHPNLPKWLGKQLNAFGNHVFFHQDLYTFPTKDRWWEKAKLTLIRQSLEELLEEMEYFETIYIPEVGCGQQTGQLSWEKEVGPLLESVIGDDMRFTIVHPK